MHVKGNAYFADWYDRSGKRKRKSFSTKYDNKQCLPVTARLVPILASCSDPTLPFVAQLPRGHHAHTGYAFGPLDRPFEASVLPKHFRTLKEKCGITRSLRPHDFRRTTATRIYDATKDLRVVQAALGHSNLGSTLWYLDHHLTQVPRDVLEEAMLPRPTEPLQTEVIQ